MVHSAPESPLWNCQFKNPQNIHICKNDYLLLEFPTIEVFPTLNTMQGYIIIYYIKICHPLFAGVCVIARKHRSCIFSRIKVRTSSASLPSDRFEWKRMLLDVAPFGVGAGGMKAKTHNIRVLGGWEGWVMSVDVQNMRVLPVSLPLHVLPPWVNKWKWPFLQVAFIISLSNCTHTVHPVWPSWQLDVIFVSCFYADVYVYVALNIQWLGINMLL